jgi:hypothetical protein
MQTTTANCKIEPVATSKTRQAVHEIHRPIRHNDLEARRHALGLSRAALGRIFDVDPATVFRQERGVMPPLWDYAMRGIDAEAKEARRLLRDHHKKVNQRDIIPDAMGERGYKYTAEKMKATKPKPRTVKAPPSPRQGMPSRAVIMAAADRAEARSKLQKESRPPDDVADAPASANSRPATISGRRDPSPGS